MQINILAIGRMKKGSDTDLYNRYIERLKFSAKNQGFFFNKLIEIPESQKNNPLERKKEEAEKIISFLKLHDFIVFFDEKGKNYSSKEFSDLLEKKKNTGKKSSLFIIGGADGFSKDLYSKMETIISFGKMTFPHQLVRILLAEQLYRAMTILGNHPYHRK